MKFTIYAPALRAAVSSAVRAISPKTPNAVLTNLVVSVGSDPAGKGMLVIVGSDGDVFVRTVSGLENSDFETGTAAIPGLPTAELLKTLPDIDVSLSFSETACTVDWGTGHASIPVMNMEDYPEEPLISSVSGDSVASLSESDFVSAMDHVAGNVATDEIRPIVNCVLLDIHPEESRAVATDMRILSYYDIPSLQAEKAASVLIPPRMANIARACIVPSDGTLKVFSDGRRVMLTADGFSVSASMTPGRYPAYMSVVPNTNSNELKADRLTLISALKRVGTGADAVSRIVKMTLSTLKGLVLEASDANLRKTARESVKDTEYSGDDLVIGFKAESLLKLLGNMKSPSISIRFSDARRAALIVPAEEKENDEPYVSIAMPCAL